MVKESVELDHRPLPDFSKVPPRHWMNQIQVNQYLYSPIAQDKCVEASECISPKSASFEQKTGSDLLFDVSAAVAVDVWKKGNMSATIGPKYLHDDNTGKGEKSVTFTVTAPEPGNYAIRFHYNTHKTRSSCTPVFVKIGENVETFSVNQRKSDGKGIVLGTFDIQDTATVTVSNEGTDGHVIVDGLELIKKWQFDIGNMSREKDEVKNNPILSSIFIMKEQK